MGEAVKQPVMSKKAPHAIRTLHERIQYLPCTISALDKDNAVEYA
jgi:hypothetical protein